MLTLLRYSWKAALIGLITGALALVFLFLTEAGVMLLRGHQFAALAPFFAGILLWRIRKGIAKDNMKFGLDEVVAEIHAIETKVMDRKDVFLKMIGTVVSLVGGFPVGRLGPIIHLGGAVGSNIAYWLRRDQEEIKLLISCGTAAGLAAIFNAPIFGTLFVLEYLYVASANFTKMIVPLMISSILSSSIVELIYGGAIRYEFVFEDRGLFKELFWAVAIGLVVGLAARLYVLVVKAAKSRYEEKPLPGLPILGGAVISLIMFLYPEVRRFEFGAADLTSLLQGSNIFVGLFILIFLAMLYITFRFGAIGGAFAPALAIGALLGGVIDPSPNGIVLGVTAMLSGYTKAPFSMTVLFVMMTGVTDHVLPFFIVSVISSIIHE